MKKKLWMLVCLCLAAMSLLGCGDEDPAAATYGTALEQPMTGQELEEMAHQFLVAVNGMGDEYWTGQLAGMSEQQNPTSYRLISSWLEAKAGEGSFVEFGDFDITEANGTLTIEQDMVFENRTLIYTEIRDADTLAITDYSFDKAYTLSEKMSKAGMNTLMGMGTVFIVLILISLIIYCFRVVPYLQNRKKEQQALVQADNVQLPETPVYKEEALQDDLELVAVISAAIAAATGSSTDDFVVRSIKRR
ncbi:MAG: OadG family protein [Lachnospiraceae bacterium]|nr:OadG family protein [Lachnospiraceae bacterium]